VMGWRPRHIRLGPGPEDEVETTHTRPGCRNGDVADTHWHRYRSATADRAAPVVGEVAWQTPISAYGGRMNPARRSGRSRCCTSARRSRHRRTVRRLDPRGR